ncbi:MAG: recombination mediator RecR [Candidatus Nealsonbacteria bacterium]|nr:recombination mediator RecR [Candidatus Nealsonbacteria bacterium]
MKSFSADKLIKIFSKFPTVGPRTAARFVFYLIQRPKEEIEELINAILEMKKNIKICTSCFNHFESSGEENKAEETLCDICADPRRDKTLLCLVEKEIDLISFEKTKRYKGLYFVLGETISAIKKSDLEKLRTGALEQRIKNHPEIQEIIIAFNPTTEGEATALYVERFLKPLNKKLTHLGRGLPTGAELEYADEETIGAALEGRK